MTPELFMLIGAGILVLAVLAYIVESMRYRWLSFEELTDVDQARLLAEASKTVYQIGHVRASPDPRSMMYYTKMARRRS